MPESEPNAGRSQGKMTLQQVLARVQQLCETPRPDGGYPVATYIEGYFLGDVTAIVAAKLRSEGLLER
ncbi:MAG: hypothetical protein ABSH51_18755 [Solirubrobacteraceae bacterium]